MFLHGADSRSNGADAARPQTAAEGVAVIAVQGRFPGAASVEQLWENLKNGVESISTFTEAEIQAAGIDPAYMNVPGYVNRGCVLDDIDQFDAAFFGYSARDAETMDPQQRIFLECAWEALEKAGYDPETYPGLIGVFAGSDQSSYLYQIYANVDLSAYGYGGMMSIGNEKDFVATQTSYKLNLHGPSMAIQTSCSTSLVAVCMACQNLWHGYCDMALAGGVGIGVPQKKGYWYQPGGILSADGHCRPFDANGQGTVVGNGIGMVVLKRLADALRDGDNVLAVIKGFALNNDGSAKVGYTAPSIDGQSQVVRMAQRMAGIDPATIGYIEAHGTATALGDPVEVAALTKAFRERTDKKQFCAIGAVKSNVGHLSSAAGITGLIKGVLTVHHGQIPPTLHYKQPNPQLDLAKTPFYVPAELTEWPTNGHPRRAGVSSFGVGGTNAHVVLEEAPAMAGATTEGREKNLLVLSGRTLSALEKATDNLTAWLERSPGVDVADVAFTLQAGRRGFSHRRTIVFDRSDPAGLVAALKTRDPGRVRTAYTEMSERSVVYLFSGQGTQYVDMGADLYRAEPVFREHLDECAELLADQIGLDLRTILYPAEGDRESAAERLKQTAMTQPALFAIEYALGRLWMEWGVTPKAMVGHSIGEYVAACLAGVMTLPEALSVVAMRGRLMDSMPGGSMLAVPLPEAALQAVLQANVSLAAVNAPSMSVLSGPAEAIDALEKQFTAQGLPCRKLHTSHAFHSSMMDPVLTQFVDRIQRIPLKPPQIPYLSNLTGSWITAELATNPDYWGYHLRQTVRFSDNLCEVMAFPDLVLLEVGPGATLGMLARQQGSRSSSQLILSSLPGPQERDHVSDSELMASTVAQLWLGGAKIDWLGYHRRAGRKRVPLPTYPFERQRYWLGPLEEAVSFEKASAAVETAAPLQQTATAAPVQRAHIGVDKWFFAPVWKPAINAVKPAETGGVGNRWLVFGSPIGLGAQVQQQLASAGAIVNFVYRGSEFRHEAQHYEMRSAERSDYDALVEDLQRRGEYPTHVLHLWSTENDGAEPNALADFDTAQERSFYSVTFLSQALAKASAAAPVHIGVVTNCLHSVIGDEPLRANESTVLGACKVLSQEYPNLRCRNIDLILTEPDNAAAAIHEMEKQPFEPVAAYRKGRRWLQCYDQVQLEKPDKMPLLADGKVYLFTGGLGNIALILAEAIAAEVKTRFVLTARSEFPPREQWDEMLQKHPSDPAAAKIRKLVDLEKAGAEVLVLRADAADREQMRSAIDQAIGKWGAIHGVVHGAANLSPDAFGAAGNVDRAAGDGHFRPKAHGLLILEELLKDQPLEFGFLLSSLSAVLGGLGLACYAASNAFLDAAARRLNHAGKTPWFSVDWDSWTFAPAAKQADAIGPEEGRDCFRRIITSGLTEVVVSTTPLADRLARWVNLGPVVKKAAAPLVQTAAAGANGNGAGAALPGNSSHPRPNLSTPFAAARTETEKSIAGVWEHLLGVSPIGIHDKFFELGGHSLLAIQLLGRLREMFEIDLPVQRIFEAPTVAQLAESIDRDRKSVSAEGGPGVDDMLELVKGLSEEELNALLAEAKAENERAANG